MSGPRDPNELKAAREEIARLESKLADAMIAIQVSSRRLRQGSELVSDAGFADSTLYQFLEGKQPVCYVAKAGLDRARNERDEADRRAGAAERKLAYETDGNRKREQWTQEAKRAAGYHHYVSFDVVWAEALAALIEKRGPFPADISQRPHEATAFADAMKGE